MIDMILLEKALPVIVGGLISGFLYTVLYGWWRAYRDRPRIKFTVSASQNMKSFYPAINITNIGRSAIQPSQLKSILLLPINIVDLNNRSEGNVEWMGIGYDNNGYVLISEVLPRVLFPSDTIRLSEAMIKKEKYFKHYDDFCDLQEKNLVKVILFNARGVIMPKRSWLGKKSEIDFIELNGRKLEVHHVDNVAL